MFGLNWLQHEHATWVAGFLGAPLNASMQSGLPRWSPRRIEVTSSPGIKVASQSTQVHPPGLPLK
jgi:hypothetical protein